MIFANVLAGLLMMQSQTAATPVPTRWYSVFASTLSGRCGFAITDVVGMSAKQLREQISEGYDRKNGFFVIVTPRTSPKCSEKARSVVTKLGFASVIVRPERDSDRQGGGIP